MAAIEAALVKPAQLCFNDEDTGVVKHEPMDTGGTGREPMDTGNAGREPMDTGSARHELMDIRFLLFALYLYVYKSIK